MKSCILRLFTVAGISCMVWFISGAVHVKAGGCPNGADVTGLWAGEARDESGAGLQWELDLEQQGPMIQGKLEWKKPGGSAAQEGVQGVLDCGNRSFVIKGYHAKGMPGNAVYGTYRGSFSTDWKKLTARWSEGASGEMTGEKK